MKIHAWPLLTVSGHDCRTHAEAHRKGARFRVPIRCRGPPAGDAQKHTARSVSTGVGPKDRSLQAVDELISLFLVETLGSSPVIVIFYVHSLAGIHETNCPYHFV